MCSVDRSSLEVYVAPYRRTTFSPMIAFSDNGNCMFFVKRKYGMRNGYNHKTTCETLTLTSEIHKLYCLQHADPKNIVFSVHSGWHPHCLRQPTDLKVAWRTCKCTFRSRSRNFDEFQKLKLSGDFLGTCQLGTVKVKKRFRKTQIHFSVGTKAVLISTCLIFKRICQWCGKCRLPMPLPITPWILH